MSYSNEHPHISKPVFPNVPKPTQPQQIPHGQPSPATDLPNVTLNAVSGAVSSMEALRTGGLHPALDYTAFSAESCTNGVFESDETVAEKAKYRQEFPF